jgi:hypothetical protein
MIVISEDSLKNSKDMFIGTSYMMDKIFDNAKIVFAGSNDSVIHKLENLIDKNDIILVFVDLIADNQSTWGVYIANIRYILQSSVENHNVFVIPFPCIEFVFNKAFGEFALEKDYNECMISRGDYKKFKNCKNFERFCKSVLYNYEDVTIGKNVIEGDYSFYRDDSCFEYMMLKYSAKLDMVKNVLVRNSTDGLIELIQQLFLDFLEQVNFYRGIEGYETWSTDAITDMHNAYIDYISNYSKNCS